MRPVIDTTAPHGLKYFIKKMFGLHRAEHTEYVLRVSVESLIELADVHLKAIRHNEQTIAELNKLVQELSGACATFAVEMDMAIASIHKLYGDKNESKSDGGQAS